MAKSVVHYLCILILCWFTCDCTVNYTKDNKTRNNANRIMVDDLLKDYHKAYRPIIDSTQVVEIRMKFSLLAISDVNVKEQQLTAKGFFFLTWNDEFLTWNVTEYPVEEIIMDSSQIWVPDLGIFNSLHEFPLSETFKVLIFPDGTVVSAPQKNYYISCNIHIQKYPFDKQTCIFEVGSWFYRSKQLTVQPMDTKVDISLYKTNTAWYLDNTFVRKVNTTINDSDMIHFGIDISRRSNYYVANLIIPALSFPLLVNFAFLIPSVSGEKISFCAAVFLSFSVFINSVVDTLPVTSLETSYIALFVHFQFLFGAIQTCLAVIVIRIGNREIVGKLSRFNIDLINYGFFRAVFFCCIRRNKKDVTSSIKNIQTDGTGLTYIHLANALDRMLLTTCLCISVGSSITILFLMTT